MQTYNQILNRSFVRSRCCSKNVLFLRWGFTHSPWFRLQIWESLDVPLFLNCPLQPIPHCLSPSVFPLVLSSPAQLLHWPLNGYSCPCSCSLKSNFSITVTRMLLEPKAGHSPACSRPPIHVHLTKNTTQDPHHGRKAPHDLTPVNSWSRL